MPLPPAPTKRAALLSPDVLDAPAQVTQKTSRRSGDRQVDDAQGAGPRALELFDRGASEAVAGAAPIATATAPARQIETRQPRPAKAGRTTEPVQARTAREPVPPLPVQALVRAPVGAPAPSPTTPAATRSRPERAAPEAVRPRRGKSTGPAKLFVLDTNVLLHDPMCLFRFEEHDIFLPMIVLEELDGHKKGMTEVARNARPQQTPQPDAAWGAPCGRPQK